jgi:hypothetical protein
MVGIGLELNTEGLEFVAVRLGGDSAGEMGDLVEELGELTGEARESIVE